MAKFKVEFRGSERTAEEIEADEVEVTADGRHYQFLTGQVGGLHKPVALIPVAVIAFVKKIED